jgi:hypothetical protein
MPQQETEVLKAANQDKDKELVELTSKARIKGGVKSTDSIAKGVRLWKVEFDPRCPSCSGRKAGASRTLGGSGS